MGKSYRMARYGVVHANVTVVATPKVGRRKGQQWTFKTLEGIDVSLGIKYATVGGTQITPVAVVLAGSDPKWSGDISLGEVREVRRWIGVGWAHVGLDLTLTWQVTGRPAFTDLIFDAYLGDEGVSSKKDSNVMAKIGSQITALWPDGIDPFGVVA